MMTMYKLLAVNSLITAFAISVLAVDGVKLGDRQTAAESMYVTILFFSATRSTPARTLTRERPAHSVTDFSVVLSVALQTAMHFTALVLSLHIARPHRAGDGIEFDADFAPNFVNTIVFIVWSALHAASFLANYEGAPFARPMSENRVLYRGIIIFLLGLLCIVFELFPDLNSALTLVPIMTPEVEAVDPWLRTKLLAIIGSDLLLSFIAGRAAFKWSIMRATNASLSRGGAIDGSAAADLDDDDTWEAPSALTRLREQLRLAAEMKAAARQRALKGQEAEAAAARQRGR
eukprot:Polyplicarium_translucidae@DN2124_c0_g1_i3.p1